MKKYKCPICQNEHDIYYGFKYPVDMAVENFLREESAELLVHDGYYIWKKKIIVMPVEIEFPSYSEENIYFQTWVEIKVDELKEQYENKKLELIKLNGKLIWDLELFYPNTKGLHVEVIYSPSQSTTILASANIIDESEIRNDQINGISMERHHELLGRMYH